MFFEATAFGRGGADAEGLTRDPALKPFVDAPGQPATLLHLAKALRTRSSINIGAFAHDCASDSRPWLRTQLCLPGLSEFGKIEEAFRLLPAGNAEEVLFWPQTAALRSDPRFMDWIKKLGLFPYWTDTRSRPDLCASENVSLCRSIAQARNRPSRSDWGAGRRLPKG